MKANTAARQQKAINSLKELLKTLVNSGVSYAEIMAFAPPGATENAIRQFVYRKSVKPRVTPLVRALLDAHGDLETRFASNLGRHPSAGSSLPEIARPIQTYNTFELGRKISDKFRTLRKRISINYLPKHLYFVRRKLDGDNIIILIETFTDETSYYFTMKISGSKNRIAVGDVAETATNLYFSGVSYHVSATVDRDTFMNMNYFDDLEIRKYISENPVGLEFASVKRVDIENEVYPAFFLGLDGRCNPIVGRGAFFNGDTISHDEVASLTGGAETPDGRASVLKALFERIEIASNSWKDLDVSLP